MNRKLWTAVSAAALSIGLLAAAPAFAQTELDESVRIGLTNLGFDVTNLGPLTVEQANEVESVLGGTDDGDAQRERIAEILGMSEPEAGVGSGAAGQLRDSAAAAMTQLGIDTEGIDMLSVEQLTEIEAAAGTDDDDGVKRARIEEIIGASATEAGVGEGAAGQLRDSVSAELAQLGIDTEGVATMSVEELTEIEAVVSSNETEADKRARIEAMMAQ